MQAVGIIWKSWLVLFNLIYNRVSWSWITNISYFECLTETSNTHIGKDIFSSSIFSQFFSSSHSPKICSGGVFQTWLYFVCLCLWWGLKSSLVVLLKKLQLQKKITFFWDLHENLLCNLTHTLNPEKMMTENCVYTYIYICPKREMRCI